MLGIFLHNLALTMQLCNAECQRGQRRSHLVKMQVSCLMRVHVVVRWNKTSRQTAKME